MTQPSPAELHIHAWIQKAEEDELTCRSLLKHRDAPPAPCCFCAQQMAEKYLKALLIFHSKNFPKIHDLKRLATLIDPYESDIFPSLEDDFNVLNKFYATTRYPGDFPEGFSWQDAETSLNAALRIKEFVLQKISKSN
ncbi:MAG: HEPN domain-containing protein [Parcubacteria group bacterium Gr01-1014_66]|nr:MAG: HEPN domain-containing protein [Parcubacteria group bacterium Gr01-1014_66]